MKTPIRFFDDIPVRSVWDEETGKWWLCDADVLPAIADTSNPRIYRATIKRRNRQLFANCKQLKLAAADVIDDKMYQTLMRTIRSSI